MNFPINLGPLEIFAIVGAFLYGTSAVFVVRSVYRDLKDDRQGDYQAL